MNSDMGTTEAMVVKKGYRQLSGEELERRMGGKTVRGDYLYEFKFITFFDRNGTMEGRNNVGAHHYGEWSIDTKNETIPVQWDGGWDNTTSRAYDVDGEIKLYDASTGQWRTTLRGFEDGRKKLIV